jgi:hypothetical protein
MGAGAPRGRARRLHRALAALGLALALLVPAAVPAFAGGTPGTPAADPFPLAVTLAGVGVGAVTSSPDGIDCGTTCTADFDADSVVVLTATPAAGSRFAGWSGDCAGEDPCTVTMTAALAVTATFDDAAGPVVHVTIDAGAQTTGDRALHVDVAATDNVPGDLVMQVGVAATGATIPLGGPTPLATSVTLTLAAGSPSGSYSVAVAVADASGNTTRATAAIVYLIPDSVTARLVPSYRLTAVLDYPAAKLTVTETLTVKNGSDQTVGSLHLSVLAHAYGELAFQSQVTVGGHAVSSTWENSADLRVPLPTALKPGQTTTLVIRFVATARTDVTDSLRARFSKTVDSNGVVMMQVSSWYPLLSNDHGLRNPGDSQFSVAAPVTMTLDIPSKVSVGGVSKSMRIAAPGVVSSAASAVPGRTIVTVKLDAARELTFAASPRFAVASATTVHLSSLGHRIAVLAYYLPGEPGTTTVATARTALDSLIAAYGPYPYDRFVVASSTRSVSGNEYSGIVFIGASRLGSAYAVSHEVAHQWFYALVGNDQLQAPWLDEGFAEYTGRVAAGIAMPAVCSTLPVDTSVYAFPNKAADNSCNGYNQTVYFKTCAMLTGVRARLGATAFSAAMRAIVATYRGKVVTEANVVAIFEAHAPNAQALDDYLYGSFLAH